MLKHKLNKEKFEATIVALYDLIGVKAKVVHERHKTRAGYEARCTVLVNNRPHLGLRDAGPIDKMAFGIDLIRKLTLHAVAMDIARRLDLKLSVDVEHSVQPPESD